MWSTAMRLRPLYFVVYLDLFNLFIIFDSEFTFKFQSVDYPFDHIKFRNINFFIHQERFIFEHFNNNNKVLKYKFKYYPNCSDNEHLLKQFRKLVLHASRQAITLLWTLNTGKGIQTNPKYWSQFWIDRQ